MPLSEPSGSAFNSTTLTLVGNKRATNNGTFVNPTYNDAWWNQINNRGVIAGLANYTGLISDITAGRVNETAASTLTALAAGFLFTPFLDDNDDIYLVGSGGLNREIGFSNDSGATWSLLPNPPGISSVIRGLSVAQGRMFVIGNYPGNDDVAFSGNLGVSWTLQFSGLLFGGNVVGITSNPDQTFLVMFDNVGELAWTSTPLGSPPTWNQVTLATGIGGNVSQGAFNKDASKFVCAGISNEIHFSEDSMGSFTQVADAVNPLDGAGTSIIDVGYSPFHKGFFVFTNVDIHAFLSEDDLANPVPIYNIESTGRSVSGLMTDLSGNFAWPNSFTNQMLYGSYQTFE